MMRHLAKAVATGALIVLLAISASPARAQTPNEPAPPASERTAHLIEAFERQVEADRNALKIPGLSIVVIQDGEVLSARGFGYADVEHRIPATPDTLYHIASVTKTFTGRPTSRTPANRSPKAWAGTSPTTEARGSSGTTATGAPASPRSTSRCRRGASR